MENITETKELQPNKESIALKNEIEKLQHELEIAKLEIANARIQWYEEQLKLNAVKKYGKSSDKIDDKQISFLMKQKLLQSRK